MDTLRIKILKKFLLLGGVVFLLIGIVSYFWIKQLYTEQVKNELVHDIELIAMELPKQRDYQSFAKNVKRLSDVRLTLVDKDGNVVADSDADPKKMENHKNRPEIFASTYKRYGVEVRRSKTLDKELLYVAKKIRLGGREYFLRLSTSFEKIYDNFLSFLLKMFFVFLVTMSAMVYVIYKISDEIGYEIDRVIGFLTELKKQTSSMEIHSKYSKEFAKLTESLSDVSSVLAKKNKKKAKYTAKLKLANRQKDEILSAVSHEFKNPISVITGYSQTLIEDKDISGRIREKFLAKIYTSAKRLTAMIDRLRLFIKLEEDSQPIKYANVDIGEMVQEVIEELSQSYGGRKIVFVQKQQVTKELDEALFRIAVTNLVENALKYSEDEVEIALDEKALRVEDKGIGIAKEEIDKITDKFYRATSNGWNNSLGIGLSLVEHIVKVHKFTLRIESEKSKGSVFTILFS